MITDLDFKKQQDNTEKRKYIVLQNFWLRDIMLYKGQIITDPLSPRWIDLRLIKPCEDSNNSNTDNNKIVIEEIVTKCECPTEEQNNNDTLTSEEVYEKQIKEVETNEVKEVKETSEETVETETEESVTPTSKKRKSKKVVELNEPSEALKKFLD